jgi:spore maturation protein SpmB
MNTFGADSLTARLSSIFQCSAESAFYVIAVYFGSVNIKNTRYALGTMLIIDYCHFCSGLIFAESEDCVL